MKKNVQAYHYHAYIIWIINAKWRDCVHIFQNIVCLSLENQLIRNLINRKMINDVSRIHLLIYDDHRNFTKIMMIELCSLECFK